MGPAPRVTSSNFSAFTTPCPNYRNTPKSLKIASLIVIVPMDIHIKTSTYWNSKVVHNYIPLQKIMYAFFVRYN